MTCGRLTSTRSSMSAVFCAWCESEFAKHALPVHWPQSNIAWSEKRGTLRGLHFVANQDEAKLVRCTRGAAYVVAADIRPNSPSYSRWLTVELTDDNHRMLFVPPRCAGLSNTVRWHGNALPDVGQLRSRFHLRHSLRRSNVSNSLAAGSKQYFLGRPIMATLWREFIFKCTTFIGNFLI